MLTSRIDTEPQRLDYLDSVRGIASMMVVIYHFIGWNWPDYTKFHVASMVFNGADAVSFFFVLSGFVLSYKYFQSDKEVKMGNYILKRILRLYPAFIFTIIVNYLYWNRALLLEGNCIPVLKDMFLNNDQKLWEELAMVKLAHKFYIPGWTLGVEMVLSLVVPVLVYLSRKNIKMIWWVIPVSICIENHFSSFALHFVLGIMLAYYYPQIKEYNFSKSKYWKFRYFIALIVFLLFSVRHIRRIFPFGSTYDSVAEYLNIDMFHYTGIASALILLFIINNKAAQKILTNGLWLFLGKISYSVYLAHWLVVVHVMKYWDHYIAMFPNFYLGFLCLLLLVILITITCATLMYYFIEKPFINLAKRYRLFA